MSLPVSTLSALLAQAPEGAPPPPDPFFSFFLPLIVIFILFMLIIQRPRAKEQQKRLNEIAALKKGDLVVSIGGIVGKVDTVDKENKRITVLVDKNVRITFLQSAIDRVLEKKSGEKAEGE